MYSRRGYQQAGTSLDSVADSKTLRCDVHSGAPLPKGNLDAVDQESDDSAPFKSLAHPRPPLKRLRLIVGNEVINVHFPNEGVNNNNNNNDNNNSSSTTTRVDSA